MLGLLKRLLFIVVVFYELRVVAAYVFYDFRRSHDVHQLVIQQHFLPQIFSHPHHLDSLADAQDALWTRILVVGHHADIACKEPS